MSISIGNRYHLHETIGSGGMGIVYRASDSQTGQFVAIKELHQTVITPEMVMRFRREAEALRQLNHPNIVKVLDTVEEDGRYYLVMELMKGGTLADLLHTPMPIHKILSLALELSDALARAHHLKIIHRDIKPANILLADDGTPRLTDFGVARMTTDTEDITQEQIVGTLNYVSPESLRGTPQDVHADIWAFGVLLFEMLTGRKPFETTSLASLVTAILTEKIPDLEKMRPDAPIALIDLVYRMLERDPQQRIHTARIIGAELELIVQGIPHTPTLPLNLSKLAWADDTDDHHKIKHNLLVQTTPFIGREADVNQVVTSITQPDTRLVSIIGYGGMGKTRLAVAVAEHFIHNTHVVHPFPNGVFFVQLAPLSSPDLIIGALISALNVPQIDSHDRSQLRDYLCEKQLLIVFDNFEHLLAGAELLNDLLESAPQLKMIVTSRERLNLSAEKIYPLQGMMLPDVKLVEDALTYGAIRLFVQSARRVRPDYTLSESDVPLVVQICHMAQGMPLGIILAATWLDTLSLAEIVQEMSQSLDFLEGEMRDLPARHRSIRATFEYSWNLLAEEERAVFIRFSVFRGGCTRQAAQTITEASLRTLTALVNKSFLKRDVDARYEVHELLRQYAAEKLPSDDPVYQKHADYYFDAISKRDAEWHDNRQLNLMVDVTTDLQNVRTAWNWAITRKQIAHLSKIIMGIYQYCSLLGSDSLLVEMCFEVLPILDPHPTIPQNRDEAIRLPFLYIMVGVNTLAKDTLQTATQLIESGLSLIRQQNTPRECALIMGIAGHFYINISDTQRQEGFALLEESLKLLSTDGKPSERMEILHLLGEAINYFTPQDDARGFGYLYESVRLAEILGDVLSQANGKWQIAQRMQSKGEYGIALGLFRDSLELNRKLKRTGGVAGGLDSIAFTLREQGDYETAKTMTEEQLKLAHEIGNRFAIASAYRRTCLDCRVRGDYARAEWAGQEAMRILLEMRDIHLNLTWIWNDLGSVSMATRNYDEALTRFQNGLKLDNEGSQNPFSTNVNRRGIADAYVAQNRPEDAIPLYEQCLAHYEAVSNKRNIVLVLTGMIGVYRLRGDFTRAFELALRALILAQEMGTTTMTMNCLWEIAKGYDAQGNLPLATYFANLVADSRETWAETRAHAQDWLAKIKK
jgi:predicted ATPase